MCTVIEVALTALMLRFLEPGALLGGRIPGHAVFQDFWRMARSDAFSVFTVLKEGVKATEAEIIAFCRSHMSGFKTPKAVVFALAIVGLYLWTRARAGIPPIEGEHPDLVEGALR